jgi:lambda family phage portal protein
MISSNDIKLSVTDRITGLFSPKRMEERIRGKAAHKAMELAMRGLFKSSERNRLNADWNVPLNFDINKVLKTELPLIRARSRWLMVNNSDAKSAQNAMINYVVGTGFDLQMSVVSVTRDDNNEPSITEFEGYNSLVEDIHRDWSDDVYLTTPANCPMSFYEFQVMALERWIQDGEVFVHVVPDRENIMRLEIIDAEALDTFRTSGDNDNPVVMGIEVDKVTQRPVAYWVMQSTVQDYSVYLPSSSIRVPADRMIHAFIRKYPKQLRGIPWMSAVIERLNQTDSYRTAQLVRNKIAAFFGILFSGDGSTGRTMFNDDPTASTQTFPTDSGGNPITALAPGMMGSLPPGVKVERIDPTSPETSYHDFMKSLLSSSAAGIEFGMSYQLMSRDTAGLSFAGGRLVTQMDAQGFRPAQRMFTSKLLTPLHKVWMEYAILNGSITSQGFVNDPTFWSRHDWLPAGWSFAVNPLQEVNASKESMNARITTLIDECSRVGLDWQAQLRKTKKVADYAKRLGVEVETAKTTITPADIEDPELQIEMGENPWLT